MVAGWCCRRVEWQREWEWERDDGEYAWDGHLESWVEHGCDPHDDEREEEKDAGVFYTPAAPFIAS